MMFDALLPGLWTAVLGSALAFSLRRWFDPVPAIVWAAFSVVILVLLGPALVAGDVLLPLDNLRGFVPFKGLPPAEPHGNFLQGDLIQLIAPSQQLVRAELLAGRWPLWNPYAGLGLPLLADPQAQPFQPLTLLALPVAWPDAAAVLAALRLLLTLTFTYLFLRRLRLRSGPALAGALAFGLSGYLLLWLGWPLANSAVFLPVVLYALARLLPIGEALAPRRRDAALLTAAASGLLLAGHPETILYVLALAVSFALLRARGRQGPQPWRRWQRQRWQWAALAATVAVCVTAPVWLPTALYLPQSARQAQLEQVTEPTSDESWDLTRDLLQVAAPNAFGNSRYLHYWGRDNSNEDAAGFAGTATLLAALLALAALRGVPEFRFFGGWLLLGLALVAQPPMVTRWLQALPVVGGAAAHGNRRLWLVVAFCLAVLAAGFLDRWASSREWHWRWYSHWHLAILGVAGLLAALIVWAYRAHPHPDDPRLLAPLRDGWLHWQLRFLIAAVLTLLLAPRRWTPWLCALLITGELLLAHGDANPPMPRHLALPWSTDTGADDPVQPAPLTYLRRNLQPDERLAALGEALPPNLASLYGLRDIRVYNPLEPVAHQQLLAPLTRSPRGNVPELEVAVHPLYERLHVRYLLTAPDELLTAPDELLTAPDETVPASWRLVLDDAAGRVYRLPWRAPCRLLPVAGVRWIVDRDEGTQRCEVPLFQDGGWHARWRPRGETRLRSWQPLQVEHGPLPVLHLPPEAAAEIELFYRAPGLPLAALLAALGWALAFTFFFSDRTILSPAGPLPLTRAHSRQH